MNALKEVRRRLRLWPTLEIRLELLPWHWAFLPWGYLRLTGGLTFYLTWLGLTIHFGCTITPYAAKKLKKEAREDTDH